MSEYKMSKQDLRDAENFLVQFQSEQVPEANLQRGGSVRDFLIKGFAAMYAYLRGEIDAVAAKQSLLRIQEDLADDDEDLKQATDEILSNWFIRRKGGKYVYVTGRFHFLKRRTQSIPSGSVFWRTAQASFNIDTELDTYIISEKQMFPLYDVTGTLIDYVVDVPLKATQPGTKFKVASGSFIKAQVAGGLPYYSYTENLEPSSAGADIETTEEVLDRADTAISVRNLVNNRSCDVVLQEEYPHITDTLTIGMNEPEMVRDRVVELSGHIQLHVGGHYDTYVTTDLNVVEENLAVGGYFARPDHVVSAFRDPALTYDSGKTFTSLGVKVGHVIYIRSGILDSPRGYPITYVSDHELHVSDFSPFTQASDTLDTNAIVYSIGWFAPVYAEIDFGGVFQRTASGSTAVNTKHIPYGTSRHISQPGAVMLSGKPVQDITWVEITNPPASLGSLVDLATATVIFHERINVIPQVAPVEPAYTQYSLKVLNAPSGQSMKAINMLYVGYADDPLLPPSVFDGLNLRVVYTSLTAVSNLDAYVNNRNHRIACANQLIKGRNPIWITVNIEYKLKPTYAGELDEDLAAEFVADHINKFNDNDDLDSSDITTAFRNAFEDSVGAVYPLTVYYYLNAPDGQQAFFSTTDLVSIFMSASASVVLENGADITPPPKLQAQGVWNISTPQQLADWYLYLGVTDRTVTYRTRKDLITFVVRG